MAFDRSGDPLASRGVHEVHARPARAELDQGLDPSGAHPQAVDGPGRYRHVEHRNAAAGSYRSSDSS